MASVPPIPMVFRAGAFHPLQRFANVVRAHYGEGEIVNMAPVEERSQASHNHYFAAVTEAWRNMPEAMGDEFPTAEHLRKRALIMTGYRDEQPFVCSSRAEALRFAAYLRPIDDFSVVTVHEAVVSRWTAKSQSMRAMGKQMFQESKDAVLSWCAERIGVTPAQLSQARAA